MNRYANLPPKTDISQSFKQIDTGFDRVQQDVDGLQDKSAELDQRLDNIINEPSPGKDAELVDVRTPAVEYDPLEPIDTAGDMTRDMQKQFVAHKAETMQQADETITVGSGGDYSTINEALQYLGTRHIAYKNEGYIVEIKLLSGFVMSEQVILNGVDLSWVRIVSEDEEVVIDRSALTDSPADAYGSYPAFAGLNQSRLPILGALFKMNDSGDATKRDGLLLRQASGAVVLSGCGVKDAGGNGIWASDASLVHAHNSNFSGALENAVRALHSASVHVRSSKLTRAGLCGIHASDSATVSAHGADCSNAGDRGAWAESASQITLQMGKGDDCGGNALEAVAGGHIAARDGSFKNAGNDGIQAIRGGTVNAQRSDFSGARRDGCNAQWGSNVSAGEANFSNAGRYGIYSSNGSKVAADGADCSDSESHAVYALNSSTIDFQSGVANLAGENALIAYDASTINARNVTANDAANDGALSQHGSLVNVRNGQIQNAGRHGVYAFASTLNARSCDVTGATHANQINVSTGGIVFAGGATGSLRQPANEVTSNGVIFQ